MPIEPNRYFGATIATLDIASDDGFTVTDFDNEEQDVLEEALSLVERLEGNFREAAMEES